MNYPIFFKLAAIVVAFTVPSTFYAIYSKGRAPTKASFPFPKKEECQYEPQSADMCKRVRRDGFLQKQNCEYKQLYCHTNIWNLVKKISKEYPTELKFCYVVFVASRTKGVDITVFMQTPGDYIEGRADWLHHVFLVHSKNRQSFVYDFDTRLDFGVDFQTYNRGTFRKYRSTRGYDFPGLFRVIYAVNYLNSYDPITGDMRFKNTKIAPLDEYTRMDRTQPYSSKLGLVLDLDALTRFFS